MSRPRLPDADMRAEARRAYGADVAGYEAGRPPYDERVYEILVERCGLGVGSDVLEIGPGTGRATKHLVGRGALVTGIEPDVALAARLRDAIPEAEVIEEAFEDVDLPAGRFDLAVAATSFHWVGQDVGLPKLGRVLRSGGWAALWWERFKDPSRPDPLGDVIAPFLTPSAEPADARPPFELDTDAWRSELESKAGLVDIDGKIIRGTVALDPPGIRALYASWILVRRLPKEQREALLDSAASVVATDFDGTVDYPFITAIYTGRRP